ncbi:outer membrane beta-barrel protein [Mucilaginibacter sp.]|uniref:outer membrane beta-barrel protein n=1 Tax=Mucilaginibacter sp. TaxID=1882438 RepID=UPI003D152C04
MKKTFTLLSIISLFSFYAKAQDIKEYVKSYMGLTAGLSSPLGDFARYDYANGSGFAKRGATVGLDGAVYVYKNLAIGGMFTFQDQGELTTNNAQTLADGYNSQLNKYATLVQGVNRYHNYNFMIGPQYSFTRGKFILDLRASAGIVKSASTPALTIIFDSSTSSEKTINQLSSTGTALAYGGSAGLRWTFAEGWDLGLKANYIDSKGVKVKNTGDTDQLINGSRLVTKQPITVLQTNLEISFNF